MISPNIFTFSFDNLLSWSSAYAIYEPITYFLIPYFFRSKTVSEYYNPSKTPVSIVTFGDYIYSTFLLLISQMVITSVLGTTAPSNIIQWCIRFFMFIAVQWVGDISFYQIISRLSPTTKYIDFFQRYGKDVGIGAPIGDSLYGVGWFILYQIMASFVSIPVKMTLIVLFMFGVLIFSW
jgi:hypothetical protein